MKFHTVTDLLLTKLLMIKEIQQPLSISTDINLSLCSLVYVALNIATALSAAG